MWPFKRKQENIRIIEITCGHNEHYHWIDGGWPCPAELSA